MKPASSAGMPDDVLIVEDDPIIALDFEDTLLGFGVKRVRSAGSVAKALELIAMRAPDFALLDVGLVREKSFAIAERLEALKIPFAFVTGYTPMAGSGCHLRSRTPRCLPSRARPRRWKRRCGSITAVRNSILVAAAPHFVSVVNHRLQQSAVCADASAESNIAEGTSGCRVS